MCCSVCCSVCCFFAFAVKIYLAVPLHLCAATVIIICCHAVFARRHCKSLIFFSAQETSILLCITYGYINVYTCKCTRTVDLVISHHDMSSIAKEESEMFRELSAAKARADQFERECTSCLSHTLTRT